jgi:hypothetical protein
MAVGSLALAVVLVWLVAWQLAVQPASPAVQPAIPAAATARAGEAVAAPTVPSRAVTILLR